MSCMQTCWGQLHRKYPMKRLSFYIAFIVLLTLVVSSCDDFLEKMDSHYHELPGYMYPEFEFADTFVYKCIQTEVLDTFLATRCELFMEYDGNSTYELFKVELTPFKNEVLMDDIFYIINHWAGASVRNNNNSLGFSVVADRSNYISEKETVEINDIKYREVRILTKENAKGIDSLIYKLWYNFDYSVVKIEMGNEMTHELLRRPF